MNDTINSLI